MKLDSARVTILLFLALLAHGCEPNQSSPTSKPSQSSENVNKSESRTGGLRVDSELLKKRSTPPSDADVESPRFNDLADSLGIEFVYDRGATGKLLMSEAIGGGAGWIDYDRDGWWDLLLIQGGNPLDAEKSSSDQLFRNRFGASFRTTDPVQTGLQEGQYGQGVSIADFDNDGFSDIYITNLGTNRLLHNQGDGTFRDISDSTSVRGGTLWSTSCAWSDLDDDGDLDLFVCNYLDYDPASPFPCFDGAGNSATCDPHQIPPVENQCFINQGNGNFTEEANQRGLHEMGSKSLGVAIADFDRDSDVDLYVANDTTANYLMINDGSGNFRNEAISRGSAMSGLGQLQASMGVAIGDYNLDTWPDLYVTHFEEDSNTLYENLGHGLFSDATRSTKIHQPTLRQLGFGAVMQDFNFDGLIDLVVGNGHIDDLRHQNKPWKMPAQLFTYRNREWVDQSLEAGEYFLRNRLSRAVALCDYDNDHAPDIAIANQEDPAAILHNDSTLGHWMQLNLIGRESNRDAIGARITLHSADSEIVSELAGGSSYCASHEHTIFLGLGDRKEFVKLSIHWPSGALETIDTPIIDRELILIEGLRSYQMTEQNVQVE